MSKHSLRGFTLVELLVVIAIIGILASLITVAAVGALRKARQTEVKAEIDQLDTAFEQHRSRTGAYPPNCQFDGTPQSEQPLYDRNRISDLKRYMKQASPWHQESEDLLLALVEIAGQNPTDYPRILSGGISADEAIVFWLGGFSSDPKFPISGDGGPSYPIPGFDDPSNRKLDPIESRNWVYPFDVSRLGPRADDGYFDDEYGGGQYIEYRDPRGITRRINFWKYLPRRSKQPYLYFDTSRYPAAVVEDGKVVSHYDPPARTIRASGSLAVYAFKKASRSVGSLVPIEFVNPNKFQILHCGIDDEWGEAEFAAMRAHGVQLAGGDPSKVEDYLVFPNGPFMGEIADTIVNFAPATRIEDAAQ